MQTSDASSSNRNDRCPKCETPILGCSDACLDCGWQSPVIFEKRKTDSDASSSKKCPSCNGDSCGCQDIDLHVYSWTIQTDMEAHCSVCKRPLKIVNAYLMGPRKDQITITSMMKMTSDLLSACDDNEDTP